MLLKDFALLRKRFWKEFVSIIFLISFLFFLLDVLIGIAWGVKEFWTVLKQKLGIYIYLSESGHTEWQIRRALLKMKNELEDAWMEVKYVSKEKAIQLLEAEVPQIVKEFEEFGIENPLPDTLIVELTEAAQYKKLEEVIQKYSDYIKNSDDLLSIENYQKQKERVKNVIAFADLVKWLSVALVLLLVALMIYIIMLVLNLLFYDFFPQIEVEKLLWGSFWQIKAPFLASVALAVVVGGILSLFYLKYVSGLLTSYISKISSIDWRSLGLDSWELIAKLVSWEIAGVVILTLIVGNLFLNRLIKRV